MNGQELFIAKKHIITIHIHQICGIVNKLKNQLNSELLYLIHIIMIKHITQNKKANSIFKNKRKKSKDFSILFECQFTLCNLYKYVHFNGRYHKYARI